MSLIGRSTSKPVSSAPTAATGEPARSRWSSLRQAGSTLLQRVQDRFRSIFNRDQFQAGGRNPGESQAVRDFSAANKTPAERSSGNSLNPDRVQRAIDIGSQLGWIKDATRAVTDDVASKVMGLRPGETATGAARQIGFEEIRNRLTGHIPADQLDLRLAKIGAGNIDGAMRYINQATDAADQQTRVSNGLQALVTMERDPGLFEVKARGKNIIQTPYTDNKAPSFRTRPLA